MLLKILLLNHKVLLLSLHFS